MTFEASPHSSLFADVFEREARKLVKHYDFSDDVTVGSLSQSENTILLVDDRERGKKYVLRIHSHRLIYHNETMIASEVDWIRALRLDENAGAIIPN